jgi:hypothetical protein
MVYGYHSVQTRTDIASIITSVPVINHIAFLEIRQLYFTQFSLTYYREDANDVA